MQTSKSLIALAIGDALGEPVEGWSRFKIEKKYGRITDFVREPTVTDDTMLTILTAESILEEHAVIGSSIARKFISNESKLGRVGPATSRALQRLKIDPALRSTSGTTNGAAMRAAPIGLFGGDVISNTVESSLVTHGTDIAISGACAIACAVDASLHESKDDVIAASRKGAEAGRRYGVSTSYPRIADRIDLALDGQIGVSMLTHESVPTAIATFYNSRNTEDAIVNAVNLGGDTDTIAAITGAISGAYYKHVPAQLSERIRIRDKLEYIEMMLHGIRR